MVESRETFRAFCDVVPVFLGVVRDGRCVLFNRCAGTLLGQNASELAAQDFVNFVHAADRKKFERNLRAVASATSGRRRFTAQLRADHERMLLLDISLAPLSFEGAPAVLIVGLDTSPDRVSTANLEEQLERAQQTTKVLQRDRYLIAAELHDGLVQTIVAAQLTLEALLEQVGGRCPDAQDSLESLRRWLQTALREGRGLISELRPAAAEQADLRQALDSLVREVQARDELSIHLQCQLDTALLPRDYVENLSRLVQEALRNVQRHAHVCSAEVRVLESGDLLHLEVQDRGVGFDLQHLADEHYGLEAIRARAAAYGGRALIQSKPGQGTLISVELPLDPRAGE